jgi:hypothetical protein
MALVHKYKKKFKGVDLKSGYFYKFKYQAFEHDNKPLIIFMTLIEGTHKNTGHQWRIIQALNMHYIPRAMRKKFLKIWMNELDKPGNIKFTWRKVLAQYPYLKMGIRRYFYKPAYYIQKLEEIPVSRIEKEVISSITKDFSGKVKRKLISKIRKVFGSRKKHKSKK